MKTKAEIIAYLSGRLTGDAAECTHMQIPTAWLRVLIDTPTASVPTESTASEQPPVSEPVPEPDPIPTPAPKRRRKTQPETV